MKESDITQPVIDKCKQIAEYWRMEIYHGCWMMVKYPKLGWKPTLYGLTWEECPDRFKVPTLYSIPADEYYSEYFPIPSISDVLRKLREYYEYCQVKIMDRAIEVYLGNPITFEDAVFVTEDALYKGENLHLALLSALLEVLKKEEK